MAISEDRYVKVAGLDTRYVEAGSGRPAILIHGASLGSSLDVWRRNLGSLAASGVRAIAYDQPGFGLTDDPPEWGLGYRTSFILKVMDALRIERAALVGHSQSGAMAVELALSHPDRVSRLVVLGTGSLLPPLPDQPAKKRGPAEGEEGGEAEPALADTRAILEANLYDHSLITDAELALRHSMSTGKSFRAFLARNRAAAEKRAASGADGKEKKPLSERLGDVRQPMLLIYGREDRGQANARAELLKARMPSLDLHIVPGCKHLVPWDAAGTFHRLAGPFLRGK